jgi:hypothetical protein
VAEVQQINFTSKYCKNGPDSNHYLCFGKWKGFNVFVICEYFCHNYKRADFEKNSQARFTADAKYTTKME